MMDGRVKFAPEKTHVCDALVIGSAAAVLKAVIAGRLSPIVERSVFLFRLFP